MGFRSIITQLLRVPIHDQLCISSPPPRTQSTRRSRRRRSPPRCSPAAKIHCSGTLDDDNVSNLKRLINKFLTLNSRV